MHTDGMIICHLPDGPTATFKLTSATLPEQIRVCSSAPCICTSATLALNFAVLHCLQNHGRLTSHYPEVILNHFNTRLGITVGRMLGALFHQRPNFVGAYYLLIQTTVIARSLRLPRSLYSKFSFRSACRDVPQSA